MNVSFVIGKSKLVPLNEKTFLKLELKAAVTDVQIKNKLIEEVKLNVNCIFFRADSNSFKIHKEDNKRFFCLHNPWRNLKKHLNKNEWHYIRSKLDVADECNPPLKFEGFNNNCRYLYGSKFFKSSELRSFSRSEDSFPINLNNIKI